jgi:3-oxoacyl-[acyl-carrier protein] reductase
MTEDLVVVTGGSRGVGRAVVAELLKREYRVVSISRTEPAADDPLRQFGARFIPLSFDLSRLEELQGLVNSISEQHGRIYGLVNNAAIGRDGVLANMFEAHIDQVLKLNVHSPILLTKFVVRSMLLNRRGRIVNISSIIAQTGFAGLSVYGASKAAMLGFTKSLAREVGKVGITVNAIAPGYMETEMSAGLSADDLEKIRRRSPLGAFIRPEDIARQAAALIEPDGEFITGSVFVLDAGSTA